MEYKFASRSSVFLLTLSLAFLMGCSEGDVQKASGEYSVTVTNPDGQTEAGRASVANSGDFFSIVVESAAGSFAVAGTMVENEIETTFTDSAGGAATAFFEFSIDRSTFTGSIQTTTGLFVIRGTRL